jgi:release factor glutamine methyltransferase
LKIQDVVSQATEQLALSSVSPRLDVELLLLYVLGKPRIYIYTYPDQFLTVQQLTAFRKLLLRRIAGEPIAYIIGHKEFWSQDLIVNKNVLIPRPETELLVELALKKYSAEEKIVCADLGTGSGAIAVALAVERPGWEIIATDKHQAALAVAQNNAQRLGVDNIKFYKGSWCRVLPRKKYNLIISNPPYIAKHDSHLRSNIKFEPKQALVAGIDGLDAIRTIVKQAKSKLVKHGVLMLEHGYNQSAAVRQIMLDYCYADVVSHRDLAGHERVTVGTNPSILPLKNRSQ